MSDDLISKKAVIEAIEKNACNTQRIFDAVKALPPIQPKRGRWEEKDFRYHCSCCDGIAPKAIRWDFCPNCGADMREVTT